MRRFGVVGRAAHKVCNLHLNGTDDDQLDGTD
jgi:hypothetical protein